MHKNDRVHLTHIRIQIKEKICYEYFLFFSSSFFPTIFLTLHFLVKFCLLHQIKANS